MNVPVALNVGGPNLGNVAGSTFNTASVTLTAGRLYLFNCLCSVFSGVPPTVSIAGGGVSSWGTALVSHVHDNFPTARQVVYAGVCTATTTGVLPVTIGASSATEAFVPQLIEVSGIDTAAPITQAVPLVYTGADPTAPVITMAALAGSGAPGTIALWSRANGDALAALLAASSGYTLLEEVVSGSNSNPGAVACSYAAPGTNTPGLTTLVAAPFVRINGLGLEIKSPAGAVNNVYISGWN